MRRVAPLLLALVLAGCGGSDDGAEARLALVIPDNNIREEGVECAGARPFRHVHRGTPFRIEAGDGTVVAEDELPAGRAVNADPSIDWNADEIPTHCVMELEVALPERPRYRLVIEGSVPAEFTASDLRRNERLRVVLPG